MRVHELAKKLDVTSKDLIAELKKHGVKAKSHMEVVDGAIAEKIEREWTAKKVEKKAVEVKKEPHIKKEAQTKQEEKVSPKKAEAVLPAAPVKTKAAEQKTLTKVPPVSPVAKKSEPVRKVADAPVVETPTRPAVVSVPPAQIPTPVVPSPVAPKQEVRIQKAEEIKKEPIKLEIPITVGALAECLRIRPSELIKTLIEFGIFANINQLLNQEIVFKVSHKLGIPIQKLEDEEEKVLINDGKDEPAQLKTRPPVVTLMGHVDHGKTSLLDAIRQSNVASREVGQITQHIGAYMVDIPKKGHVTFLDTPGHEAFTAMRARGANVTDIVVLVVAADDGVMPQTIEAVDHARAANCPIVVAINKCDLPAANPQRVMAELQKMDLVPEEWGGKTICVKVSAKTGKGIEELLELLLLEAEVMELKANPGRLAQGTVLEARLSKGQGSVATVVVQNGTLKVGDLVVAGSFSGKVRALRNDRGKAVKDAGPSNAVELLGLSGTPEAGEIFHVVADEKIARKIAEKRELEMRERAMKGLHPKHLSLEDLYGQVKEGKIKELKLIIKADVQGSIEALSRSLEQAVSEKIKVRILHGAVGGINDSDIMLAAASDAVIIGFHVKIDERAQQLAEKEGVDVRIYHIIYEALDDVHKAMEGLLEPTMKETIEGKTEIRKMFASSKIGKIGGAFVLKGKILRNQMVRVVRDNIVVHQGRLASLKRFQDDVREVAEGYDCGIVVEGFNDLRAGDIIESYRVEKVATKLV